jgi:hypothetical protein
LSLFGVVVVVGITIAVASVGVSVGSAEDAASIARLGARVCEDFALCLKSSIVESDALARRVEELILRRLS